MQKTYPTLYKFDSKGKCRVWWMEQDGDKYRTWDGLEDGNQKHSAWKTAKPKNVGRSNETTGVEQATAEIASKYENKSTRAYHYDREAAKSGAHFFEPMLAPTKGWQREKFTPGDAQPKLDGFRGVMKKDGVFSRQGKLLLGVQWMMEDPSIKLLFEKAPETTIDGELYNHDMRESFEKLSSLIKKGTDDPEEARMARETIQFHVYDVPSVAKLWEDRRDSVFSLATALENRTDFIKRVETVPVATVEEFDEYHGEKIAQGYEGSMWRCLKGPYECGKRSKHLQKRKDFEDHEYYVVRIEEGEGNWAGAAKRVVCWLPGADRTQKPDETNTFEAGMRGSYERNVELLNEDHKIVTIRHFGWTNTEIPKPRFGVATKWHGDRREL